MELLRFSHLECHYGARTVFDDVSGVMHSGERIGLVGPNGAGKSSLLRLLAGVEAPFGGSIARVRDARLGYLAQSVADETEATLSHLIDAALARADDAEWGLRKKTLRTMLAAFGFSDADADRPMREFSGGQRAKAALAHLLIDDHDYFILDEPTNHLDVETVRWLESYLANDKRSAIVVSHDRYFLDRVATRIWEIERGTLHVYPPSTPAYTAFITQRATRIENEQRAYDTYIAERDKRRTTIAGLRATHTSSDYAQVRSRERQLARIEEATDVPVAPVAHQRIAVRLDASRRASDGIAFEAKRLSKGYARPLFTDLSFELTQRERLAVVGPNGAGKSTLLKILSDEITADSGTIRWNPAISVAYFSQNAHDQLDRDARAVDAVMAIAPVSPERARGLLGRLRISGEAADKPVHAFSGGERRRIMLAALMGRAADVLLLDEPTNDLDIDSREALESVLAEYDGAFVVVSHDRYLLSRLCERVLWIDNGAWGELDGGYDAYESTIRDRATRENETATPDVRPKASRMTSLKQRSTLETQIARIEREIASIDTRKAEIERLFTDPSLYDDRAIVKALQDEVATLEKRGTETLLTWESLLEQLETLNRSATV